MLGKGIAAGAVIGFLLGIGAAFLVRETGASGYAFSAAIAVGAVAGAFLPDVAIGIVRAVGRTVQSVIFFR